MMDRLVPQRVRLSGAQVGKVRMISLAGGAYSCRVPAMRWSLLLLVRPRVNKAGDLLAATLILERNADQ